VNVINTWYDKRSIPSLKLYFSGSNSRTSLSSKPAAQARGVAQFSLACASGFDFRRKSSATPTPRPALRRLPALLVVVVLALTGSASAQQALDVTAIESASEPAGALDFVAGGPDVWTSPEGLSSALQIMLMLTVLSMAPAILLMTTSFIRIAIVLGLLRQALGLQQLPPSQVITAIAMFMTVLIMTPVWTEVYEDAIVPYTDASIEMSLDEAWDEASRPLRRFMSRQIEIARNSDDVWLFYEYSSNRTQEPKSYDDVPMQVLLPAFMLSELKVAFLIGFQVYLPFLILDIVIASVTISMGMLMLPPVMISLPFKLMLFVLVDGWTLVVRMLMESFTPLVS
jgi:flagellar biosynthetic protein FliP